MITLRQTPHSDIISYFQPDDVFTLFSRYVCHQKPMATSLTAWEPSGICGTLVTGSNCGLPHIFSFWLSADTPEVAQRLLEVESAKSGNTLCLNFPLHYTDVVQQLFPMRVVTHDLLYILHPSHFRSQASPYPITPITSKLLDRMILSQDIASRIGNPEELYEDMPFYGMIADNQVIALGEALVACGRSAAIQQVYTVPTYRGEGLGSAMVSAIAERLLHEGKMPVYWVAEDNNSSIRIVQKLGFEFAMSLGCLE